MRQIPDVKASRAFPYSLPSAKELFPNNFKQLKKMPFFPGFTAFLQPKISAKTNFQL